MHLLKTYVIAIILTLFTVLTLRPETQEGISPLEPVDTNSPRATLMGFINTQNMRYAIGLGPDGPWQRYMASSRLMINDEEEVALLKMFSTRHLPAKYMDLSGIPDASKMESMWRLSAQLKEILDRLPIPPAESIPDAKTMERENKTSWQLPGAEIFIRRVEAGPNAGSYLFSVDTVAKIPAFYTAVKDLPYLDTSSANLYNLTFHYPTGPAMFFRHVLPVRWFMQFPAWTLYLVADQPVWRWISIFLTMAVFIILVRASRYFGHRLKESDHHNHSTWELLPFITLVVITPGFSWFFAEILRVSGVVYSSFNAFFWGTFFVALTWLVWKGGQIIAEAIIAHNELKEASIDSQIVRLSFRLLSLILSLAMITEGANRLGMPAYSILTGLGIGGLAVALAAQHTLANLLGSLIIMFEKPFRVGHWIKAGAVEGIVEDLGFRSTRIRTLQNSVVSVPSSDIVNQSIENMTTRKFRLARRQIYISLQTPIAKLEELIEEIRTIIQAGGHNEQNEPEVLLKSISNRGYEVMFDFRVQAHNESEEFKEQQRILLAIARKAEKEGIQFSRYNDLTEMALEMGGHHGGGGGGSGGGEGESDNPAEAKTPSESPLPFE